MWLARGRTPLQLTVEKGTFPLLLQRESVFTGFLRLEARPFPSRPRSRAALSSWSSSKAAAGSWLQVAQAGPAGLPEEVPETIQYWVAICPRYAFPGPGVPVPTAPNSHSLAVFIPGKRRPDWEVPLAGAAAADSFSKGQPICDLVRPPGPSAASTGTRGLALQRPLYLRAVTPVRDAVA